MNIEKQLNYIHRKMKNFDEVEAIVPNTPEYDYTILTDIIAEINKKGENSQRKSELEYYSNKLYSKIRKNEKIF